MILWGVRCEGSFVVRCYDGPSAFREEGLRLSRDASAQAVVSRDGGETWVLVPWSSAVRPAPRQPLRGDVRPCEWWGVARGRGSVSEWLVGRLRADSARAVRLFRRRG